MQLIKVTDWSLIKGSLPAGTHLHSERANSVVNLGLFERNDQVRTKGYVGIVRLKSDAYGEQNTAKETILQVMPRFEALEPVKMLQALSNDDEFNDYLSSMQTTDEPLFHFFDDEPIKLEDKILRETNLLTVMLFLNTLKRVCMKPLYGRMVRIEENMVSKIKGKIVIHKHIKQNVLRARPERMYCSYQQFQADIIENQYLKLALVKAKRFIESSFTQLREVNEILAFCTQALRHISLPTKAISRKDLPTMRGLYGYYNEAFALAEMVNDEFSIDFKGDAVQTGYVMPYAINMQMLFEFYVRHRIKQHLQHKPWKMMPYLSEKQVLENTSLYIAGHVKPDIILTDVQNVDNVYAVLDVKYKDFKKRRGSGLERDDRLQILAYGLMYNPQHIGHVFPDVQSGHHEQSFVTNRSMIYHELVLGGEGDQGEFEPDFLK